MRARTVKLTLAFDGTRYEGWQSQRKDKTLQEIFEKVLRTIFGVHTPIIGSSRTDSGVHARGFVAHFRTTSKLSDREMKKALNFHLPRDIVVYSAQTVHEGFHARFHARSKVYRYCLWTGSTRPLFEAPYVLWHPQALNTRRMGLAAKCLKGRHDFRAFCNNDEPGKGTVRTIQRISVSKEGKLVRITVAADGFLKHMVRVIVGTLLEVGRGKMRPETLCDILRSRDRKKAGPTAKAQGLTLLKVKY